MENYRYRLRGIRGAITVKENSADAIEKATVELLQTILSNNNILIEDIASVLFTLTRDLNAQFPAKAAREYLKWENIPMICAREIAVPGSIEKCVRVLIHVNTALGIDEIKHMYLGDAANLRPDISIG